ncbi:MAG: riboflavin synthase [Phycisphaerae bacterium]
MFTGIIRHIGEVVDARATPAGRRLVIDLGPLADGLALGDSVAVSGACLTVSEIGPPRAKRASFDVIAETLAKTTLGSFRRGSRVNLERSLRADQGLDGHIVQGHVDGMAAVNAVRATHAGAAGQHIIEFTAGEDLTGLMVPKGSVAIDGVSLTLVDVTADAFSVALIPTTLAETTLGELRPSSKVNVETDIIGRYVAKYLRQIAGGAPGGGLTMEKLRESGFI